jgi:hypothetical protein
MNKALFVYSSVCIYFFTSFIFASDKVLIITHSYNRPDFIEMQDKTFKKFVQDEYEFVVFNDARDQNMANQINDMCVQCGIQCIRIPQEIHTRPYLPRLPKDPLHRPNIRHANCTQYSLDILGFDHDGIVLIIDSDMFLTRPFHISEYMNDKDIVALIKGSKGSNNKEVSYLCPALCFLRMDKLSDKRSLNFNCGRADGASVDSGGWTYFYLKKHPDLRVVGVNSLWSFQLFLGNTDINRPADDKVCDEVKVATYIDLGFNEKEIKFLLEKPDTFEYFLDKYFLHYHGGTNHNNLSQAYHDNKTKIFNEFFEDILQD